MYRMLDVWCHPGGALPRNDTVSLWLLVAHFESLAMLLLRMSQPADCLSSAAGGAKGDEALLTPSM